MTTQITMSEAVAAYREGNNAGRGFEPDGKTIGEAVEAMVAEGGELLLARRTSDDVAVVRSAAGDLVAIGGDAGGSLAWAVRIS